MRIDEASIPQVLKLGAASRPVVAAPTAGVSEPVRNLCYIFIRGGGRVNEDAVTVTHVSMNGHGRKFRQRERVDGKVGSGIGLGESSPSCRAVWAKEHS